LYDFPVQISYAAEAKAAAIISGQKATQGREAVGRQWVGMVVGVGVCG